MYCTEGYVDKQTYGAKGHVLRFTMEQKKRVCYVWCILPQNAAERERTKKILADWAGNELAGCLENGKTALQREVNRFGRELQDMLKGHMSPVLCVYFRGNIFSYGEENGAYKGFRKPLGIYLSPEVWKLEKVQAYLKQTERKKDVCPEEMANMLKRYMLQGMSEGKIGQGYFLIWEDRADV